MRITHHHEFYEYFLVWEFLYQHFQSKWQKVSEKYTWRTMMMAYRKNVSKRWRFGVLTVN